MSKDPTKPRVKRHILFLAPLLLATTAALTVWMAATIWASYVPEASIDLSSYNSEDHAGVTSNFRIPGGDVNFAAVVTYFPPDWGIALDEDVPDGAEVGSLDAQATLGLAIGQQVCNTALAPGFTLYEATTGGGGFDNTGDMIAGSWNGYDPDCPGQGNGEKAICEYPNFLDQLFPRPIARYYGHAVIIPGLESALNFLVFEPGTSLGSGIPTDAAWGFPSVTVLNDTGVNNPNPEPSSLADFCTPLVSNNTVNGEADGVALRTNPKYGGTYVFRSWSLGLPDVDGDGFENGVDTCPYVDNLGNIRVQGATGDADLDGFDDACDPNTASPPADLDEDNDGYVNRGDNCPAFANGVPAAPNPGPNNQADADDDGIGDSCDNNPAVIDGTRPEDLTEIPVDIQGPPRPVPTEGDRDGDGVSDADEVALGSDPDDPNSKPENLSVEGTCTDKKDNDLDGDIDADDAGCAATVTATGTATVTGTATPTETATPTLVAGEGCAPVIPGTYNGLVRLNGVPAAAGYVVSASIDGTPWGSAIVSGGRYALDVPQKLPSAEPCFAGGTITFAINGATCEPTEEWASGLHDVDLSCAPAATPTPPVVGPTTPPGTPPVTPVVTPAKPPVTGSGGLGDDQELPLWAIVVAGWAALTALAGVGTLATRIVRR